MAVIREKLIMKLANRWRRAENYFLETLDDCKKWDALDAQQKANLTPEETKDLEDTCTGMGV